MNVLIASVGRRAYMVEYFREVVAPVGGRVVTANSEPMAAGLLAGDRRFVVPRIDDPAYLPSLLKIVEDEHVGLVLSLFDLDLPVLAAASPRFGALGAVVAVSDPQVIDLANDKWLTFEFLTRRGLPTPATWLGAEAALDAVGSGQASFPLVVKPRWGMGSIGVMTVHGAGGLRDAVERVRGEVARTHLAVMAPGRLHDAVVLQQFIAGSEYGADVFNDLEGRHLATSVKRKLAMRSGETDAAVTVSDPDIEGQCARLASLLRHRGNLDVDLIRSPDGVIYVLEFNARFGGGYPFSHLAGARFPRALVQLARGEMPDPGRVVAGVHALKDILPRAVDPALG